MKLPTQLALVAASLFSLSVSARANVGVFSGSGHTVKLTESAEIQLVRERVEIRPHRGPRLFTGGVPVDRVDFDCTFVLRNLKDQAVKVQVGFPLDSQFLSPPYDPKEDTDTADLVHQHRFIARDDNRTYHTTFQPFTETFGSTFLWSMDFAPGETRTLRVSYGMNMSMSLGDMVRREDRASRREANRTVSEVEKELPWLEHQGGAIVEWFQYITATGASWAGKIERAEFVVHTWQFEEYLAARVPMEASPLDRPQTFPMFVDYPTRFARRILPAGYETKDLSSRPGTEASLHWTFAPFEAGEPLVGSYFKSIMPSTPEGARDLCRKFVEEHSADLRVVRQFFAAWMGIAPTHKTLLKFCGTQRWYEPVDGLTVDDLSDADRSVLAAIDEMIEEAK